MYKLRKTHTYLQGLPTVFFRCVIGFQLFLNLLFLRTEVDCGEPRNAPANAVKSGKIHTLGSVISYTCKKGYHIAGQQNHVKKADMQCLYTGRWSASAPRCESK